LLSLTEAMLVYILGENRVGVVSESLKGFAPQLPGEMEVLILQRLCYRVDCNKRTQNAYIITRQLPCIMIYSERQVAGTLLFVGGVQCVLGIIISEALYPGYRTSIQTISSLGVGPSALIFNSSVFLIGVLGLAGTYFVHRAYNFGLFTFLLGMTHIGAVGVGLFTEATSTFTIHSIFSVTTYLFGGISAITSYKLQKQPLSSLSIVLGVFSLLALVLVVSETYLGLGLGGMERMVAYPLLLWEVAFGSHLIGLTSRD